ncbi:MAG: ribosomal-processing cysteine protease Prp [Candidatus Eremiobacteraeota bacterium]|nr:ribosomal-processing cysteine protease Prp [Candidatus Eremiobacteraeota bacterium]
MLEVVFHRDGRDRVSSVFARGHAEYAADADDLVCAAVSAVLQAARLGLEQCAGIALDAHQQSGDFRIRWPEAARDDERVRAIVGTAELAVAQIARQYPDHVTCNTARETG